MRRALSALGHPIHAPPGGGQAPPPLPTPTPPSRQAPSTCTDRAPAREAAARAAGMGTPIERALAPISQRYILYYPALQQLTGSANAALMLSQMIYWTRKFLVDRPERGGWFWHTAQDWQQCTGLTRHEQDHARACLLKTGCVQERLMGTPARMHYRVDLDALGQAIARLAHREVPEFARWRWEDRVALTLLGRPVAFLRAFAAITGSVTAALYLSDLSQHQRIAERDALQGACTLNGRQRELDAGEGWLDLPVGLSANRLGLSGKRLRAARRLLVQKRLIEEAFSGGVRPCLFTRVNLAQIAEHVARLPRLPQASAPCSHKPAPGAQAALPPAVSAAKTAAPQPRSARNQQQVFDFAGMAETRNPEVPKPANWIGANVHSRDYETGKLDVPKAASWFAALGNSIRRVSTPYAFTELPPTSVTTVVAPARHPSRRRFSELTHPQTLGERAGVASITQRSFLILPEGLQEGDRLVAQRLLESLPMEIDAQLIADEWAGNLRMPGKVRVPLAYLHGLIERARIGQFTPAVAFIEERGRVRRQQNEAAREAALQRNPSAAATTNPQTPRAAGEAAPTITPPAQRSVMPESFLADMQRLGWGKRRKACQA